MTKRIKKMPQKAIDLEKESKGLLEFERNLLKIRYTNIDDRIREGIKMGFPAAMVVRKLMAEYLSDTLKYHQSIVAEVTEAKEQYRRHVEG